jgi:two-component system, cell cycle sensor histidine kinase and response regulator CckA
MIYEKRVLIVDDDEDFALILTDVLESRDYTVKSAGTAADALELCRDFKPDVALLDIRIGKDNGIEIIQPLKEIHPPLICVMMTAYSGTDNAVLALRRGAYDYLRKPLETQELLHTLERCYEKIYLQNEKIHTATALLQSEKRLEMVMRAAAIGLWDWDLDSGEVLYDENWLQMINFGLKPIERGLEHVLNLVHPDDIPRIKKELISHLKGETPYFDIEYQMLDRNGTWHWIYTRAMSLERDEKGWVHRVAGSHMDITDKKLAEFKASDLQNQLQHAQKIEAVGTLASGIAHDFNNILTVINGQAELLKQISDENDPNRPYYEEILQAGDRGAALTRQLLAFSRKDIVEVTVFDIGNLIRDMKKIIFRLIGEDIFINTELPDKPVYIEADPGQVEQVILNLTLNARDAILEADPPIDEPRIHIRCQLLENANGRPEKICLQVADNGIGIKPEEKEKIFEPFFTTKAKGKGTGLGLATVQNIVERYKGVIQVESEPGNGTIMKVFLPAKTGKPADTLSTQDTDTKITGSEWIFIVEDDDSVRIFAEKALLMQGYKVISATHGKDALSKLEKFEYAPDILFSDIVMPGFSGFELAEQFIRRFPKCRILLTTGYANMDNLNHSGYPILSKPYTVERMLKQIRKLLDGDKV